MEQYYIALIGFAGLIVAEIVSGIIQIRNTNRTIKIAQNQFNVQMEQNKDKYLSQLKRMRDEQKQIVVDTALEYFNGQSNRYYSELDKRIHFYEKLSNELFYINSISHPNNSQIRIELYAYPVIANNIGEIVNDNPLSIDVAYLLGALRCNIDLYNATLKNGASPESLEEAMARIYNLIEPINQICYENYLSDQSNKRKNEVEKGKDILKNISRI